jgi:Ca2+/H+ antiporter
MIVYLIFLFTEMKCHGGITPLHAACINGNIAVWETTACQLGKGEWKFQVASKIHFILAGLASNTCKASRNMKTLAIVKSTLAKLCGVMIVYLIFLFTEMKCHGGMFSNRVQ